MHKIITTAALLAAGTALSNAADLVWGFDFDTVGSSGGIAFENLGNGSSGTVSKVGQGNSTYANWLVDDTNTDIAWGGSGKAHSPNGATFTISGLNLDVSSGVSITSRLYSVSAQGNWSDYFSLTLGGTYFKIEKKGR